jgi:hypothetical protein
MMPSHIKYDHYWGGVGRNGSQGERCQKWLNISEERPRKWGLGSRNEVWGGHILSVPLAGGDPADDERTEGR